MAVLLDIETQRDFFDSDGACYLPTSLAVARQVRRLFHWAKATHTPVISTVLRLSRGELGPMSTEPHCIADTRGEQKLPGTVLPSRVNYGLRNVTDLPADPFADHQQLIFEKRDTDILQHARIERLISEMAPASFIVCGAGVGQGLVEAVVGLRSRGFEVFVASDAILDLNAPGQYLPLERMAAKGAIFVPTDHIVAPQVQLLGADERGGGGRINHGAA
ncbi:MAG: isochorismatase family protein [Planctomycetota bacterium]|jgi:isochorismate hydrolase